jgi:hypothetical protein
MFDVPIHQIIGLLNQPLVFGGRDLRQMAPCTPCLADLPPMRLARRLNRLPCWHLASRRRQLQIILDLM